MPRCGHCGTFVYKNGNIRRPAPPPAPSIARCTRCGDEFTWLPPNFDMRHRFRKGEPELCNGEIVQIPADAPGETTR